MMKKTLGYLSAARPGHVEAICDWPLADSQKYHLLELLDDLFDLVQEIYPGANQINIEVAEVDKLDV